MRFKYKILVTILLLASAFFFYLGSKNKPKSKIPLVAIANYGPHFSLEDSIIGIKQELKDKGFIEGKNIEYKITDVGFDNSLIPQMVTSLYASKPSIMVAMTTPVSQFAKHYIKSIPLIFNVVTDPVVAGLLRNENMSEDNITCVSDKQDLTLLLGFAKSLIPSAKRVGLLYSTSEANDLALLKMLKEASDKENMELVSVPIDQVRDIEIRMQLFKDKVDFIYVGTSGPIQPALPSIAAIADKMHIPVFNANEEAVKQNMVLASYGVNYIKIGRNTGAIIAELLNGGKISLPVFPAKEDHKAFISKKKAEFLGIEIPKEFSDLITE